MSDLRRLLRWLSRARPPRRELLLALAAGLLASLSGLALSVGALGLLVESARRPGLSAVLGVLIVIELLAFLRSPVRFAERMSAHRLGLAAVTHWRRWLVSTVGRWSYERWRSQASGDLLERALRDTDELQDLWLRAAIPTLSAAGTALIGDLVLVTLPSRASWWPTALLLGICQLGLIAGTLAHFPPLARADRLVRENRSRYRSVLVELAVASPELALLERDEFAQSRSGEASRALSLTEASMRRRARSLGVVGPLGTAVGLVVVLGTHPSSAPLWIVIATLLGLASLDYAATWRTALETAIAVNGAAERLDALEPTEVPGHEPWPARASLELEDVRIDQDGPVVRSASLTVQQGRHVALVGPSGAGKSALLRAAVGLESPTSGRVMIDGVSVASLKETALRAKVSYVSAEVGLTDGFVRDVIAMGRHLGRDYLSDLSELGLRVDADTRWANLSRGERERVGVVRALAVAPQIVVLDEPTSGLGAQEVQRVLDLLTRSGVGVLVATHDQRVIDWCDDVVALEQGVTVTR